MLIQVVEDAETKLLSLHVNDHVLAGFWTERQGFGRVLVSWRVDSDVFVKALMNALQKRGGGT